MKFNYDNFKAKCVIVEEKIVILGGEKIFLRLLKFFPRVYRPNDKPKKPFFRVTSTFCDKSGEYIKPQLERLRIKYLNRN